MKKAFVSLLAAVILAACTVQENGNSSLWSRLRSESYEIHYARVVVPTMLCDRLLLVSDYLRATDEEKEAERFKGLDKAIFRGDKGSYSFYSSIKFEFSDAALDVKGTRFSGKVESVGAYLVYDFEIECIETGKEWIVTLDKSSIVNLKKNEDGVLETMAEGNFVSNDGYDIHYWTSRPFVYRTVEMRCVDGVLNHTVSSGSTVLNTCYASFLSDGDIDFKVTNK